MKTRPDTKSDFIVRYVLIYKLRSTSQHLKLVIFVFTIGNVHFLSVLSSGQFEKKNNKDLDPK